MAHDRCSSERTTTVAVVGAGAAGTLVTASLLRADPTCRVELVDPAERPGPGLAYGTDDPAHLLNVRAGRMSAFADEPDHFVSWAKEAGMSVRPTDFLARGTYGTYLTDLLAESLATRRVRVHQVRAVDVMGAGDASMLVRTTGGVVRADAVVLALGNNPPAALPWEVDGAGEPWCVPDPWAAGALDGLPSEGPVLLAGTGLTAVDVASTLGAEGRCVVAASRHGLLPATHLVGPEPVWPTTVPAGDGLLRTRELVASLRAEITAATAAGVDWRAVVDGLRPAVPGIWARLPEEERRTFLRHVVRYWEVHRHRMAPEVARKLADLRRDGRLAVRRARLVDAVSDGAGCLVREVAPDGGSRWRRFVAVVNCTGPNPDPTRPPGPLVDALLARGLVRPDPLRLGLDVAAGGGLVDRGGRVNPRLLAIGALRRGHRWESTAVPEIRQQAADLAATLTRSNVTHP